MQDLWTYETFLYFCKNADSGRLVMALNLKNIIKAFLPYGILQCYRKFKNKIVIKCNFKWFGNDYGGFYICPDLLKYNNGEKIIYSIGIGEDISFDLDIIKEFPNCKIYAFDPTPKSIEWIKKQHLPKNMIFFHLA